MNKAQMSKIDGAFEGLAEQFEHEDSISVETRGRDIQWCWTQRCRLSGESNPVYLTDEEKEMIEKQPSFTGWHDREIERVIDDE